MAGQKNMRKMVLEEEKLLSVAEEVVEGLIEKNGVHAGWNVASLLKRDLLDWVFKNKGKKKDQIRIVKH